jgi:hypothetical protein
MHKLSIFCPICNSKLSIEIVEGKQVLKCAEHGEMKFYLEQDPKVSVAVAEHCDAVGLVDLEAP